MRLSISHAVAVFAVALLTLAGSPASAEQAQPSASAETEAATSAAGTEAPAEAKSGEDPDEVICKKLPAETGTRLGKRKECRTRREWQDIEAEAKQNLEKAQSRD
jgi:hypothetical protein